MLLKVSSQHKPLKLPKQEADLALTEFTFGPDTNGVQGKISYVPRGKTIIGLVQITAPGWDEPVWAVTFANPEQARMICQAFGQDPEICAYFAGTLAMSMMSAESRAMLDPSFPEFWTGGCIPVPPEQVYGTFQTGRCGGCSKCKRQTCDNGRCPGPCSENCGCGPWHGHHDHHGHEHF